MYPRHRLDAASEAVKNTRLVDNQLQKTQELMENCANIMNMNENEKKILAAQHSLAVVSVGEVNSRIITFAHRLLTAVLVYEAQKYTNQLSSVGYQLITKNEQIVNQSLVAFNFEPAFVDMFQKAQYGYQMIHNNTAERYKNFIMSGAAGIFTLAVGPKLNLWKGYQAAKFELLGAAIFALIGDKVLDWFDVGAFLSSGFQFIQSGVDTIGDLLASHIHDRIVSENPYMSSSEAQKQLSVMGDKVLPEFIGYLNVAKKEIIQQRKYKQKLSALACAANDRDWIKASMALSTHTSIDSSSNVRELHNECDGKKSLLGDDTSLSVATVFNVEQSRAQGQMCRKLMSGDIFVNMYAEQIEPFGQNVSEMVHNTELMMRFFKWKRKHISAIDEFLTQAKEFQSITLCGRSQRQLNHEIHKTKVLHLHTHIIPQGVLGQDLEPRETIAGKVTELALKKNTSELSNLMNFANETHVEAIVTAAAITSHLSTYQGQIGLEEINATLQKEFEFAQKIDKTTRAGVEVSKQELLAHMPAFQQGNQLVQTDVSTDIAGDYSTVTPYQIASAFGGFLGEILIATE